MDQFGKTLINDMIKRGIEEKRIDPRVLDKPKDEDEDEEDLTLEEQENISKATFKN